MLIGVGKQQNGLYFLREMEVIAAVHSLIGSSLDDWYRRLSDPFSKVLAMLKFLI